MIAPEEKVAITFNDDVLEVGRDRIVGILTEVILKNMDSVSSGVKRFTDVDGSCEIRWLSFEANDVGWKPMGRQSVL